MSISKINPIYPVNQKASGDTLAAQEWNDISSAVNESHTKINQVIDAVNAGGGSGGSGSTSPVTVVVDPNDPSKEYVYVENIPVGELTDKGNKGTNVTLAGNNNVNVEPRAATGTGEGKNNPSDANRKGGNIALKPGDDIELYSHKRGTKKNTEVAIKALDGNENPVKLQIISADMTFSVKDKNLTKAKTTEGEDIKTPYRTTKDFSGGKNKPVVRSGGVYYLAASNDEYAQATSTVVPDNQVESSLLYDDPNVLNINVTTGADKGYLKVRAQAIDLRSETHGGIAIQPRGKDSDSNENKIKFEHGGGDGLEFGTFNTEKTSIYTEEYRFKKDGVVKLATRTKLDNTPGQGGNDKYKGENMDPTTRWSYKKNPIDDFYDEIASGDPTCTWEDIINVASTLNGTQYTRTHITDGGNVEIETKNTTDVYKKFKDGAAPTTANPLPVNPTVADADVSVWYSDSVDGVNGASRILTVEPPKIQLESTNEVNLVSMNPCVWDDTDVTAANFATYLANNAFGTGLKKDTEAETKYVDGLIYGITNDDRTKSQISMASYDSNLRYVKARQIGEAGGVNIESDAKIKLSAPKLTLEGVTGFGSTMTFGEADEGIRYQYKATKKGKNKQCDVLQVEVFNNGTETVTFNEATHLASNSNNFVDENGDPVAENSVIPTFYKTGAVSVPAGEFKVVAQCSIMDIIKLVNYMKTNQQGPWAQQ